VPSLSVTLVLARWTCDESAPQFTGASSLGRNLPTHLNFGVRLAFPHELTKIGHAAEVRQLTSQANAQSSQDCALPAARRSDNDVQTRGRTKSELLMHHKVLHDHQCDAGQAQYRTNKRGLDERVNQSNFRALLPDHVSPPPTCPARSPDGHLCPVAIQMRAWGGDVGTATSGLGFDSNFGSWRPYRGLWKLWFHTGPGKRIGGCAIHRLLVVFR
jgi:hypothetical protein